MSSKVLIVEDQPSMAAMVRHHVETAGFEVVAAGDVDAAWDLMISERPEAAIVDIQLPGQQGWELISRSRVDERTRQLPLMVLTGLHGSEVREKAEAFGAEYFTKPFAASALINRLSALVHNNGAEVAAISEIAEIAEIPDTPETLTRDTFADALASLEEGLSGRREIPPPPAAPPIRAEQTPEAASGPIDLVAVSVVLLLQNYQVEGFIHMPTDLGRFSDSWEAMFDSPRAFVPVTDAKVIVQGGPKAVAATQFLQVKKSDITGVFPTDL